MGILYSIERMRSSSDACDHALVRRTCDMLIAINRYSEFEQILLIDSRRFFTSEGKGRDGQINRQMDGQMDGWMDGWIDGWIDGWMDGWMD